MNTNQKYGTTLLALGVAAYVLWNLYSANKTAVEEVEEDQAYVNPDLVSGGLPTAPSWYWGANSGVPNSDIYVNVNPEFLAQMGYDYTPLFGFVGFASGG